MQARSPATIAPSPLLSRLFAHDVIAVETRQPIGGELLLPEEAPYVARAAPKRVADFAAGRACAREALAQLGIRDFVLHVGADREPLWPPQAVGSITHTAGFCGVVVASRERVAALGIDAEERYAVRRELWPGICTNAEQQWLAGLPPERAVEAATAIFCAKEAFFKCQYPLTRQWLNFEDVHVKLERGAGFALIEPQRMLQLSAWQPPPWPARFAQAAALTVAGCSIFPVQRLP